MSTCVKTICTTDGFSTEVYSSKEPKPKFCIYKEQWTQHYAGRILKLWLQWQTPLGVARNYVDQLKEDLAEFYDEPLKKMFIEAAY